MSLHGVCGAKGGNPQGTLGARGSCLGRGPRAWAAEEKGRQGKWGAEQLNEEKGQTSSNGKRK